MGDICSKIANISHQMYDKGSLLLPCSKMPFDIFLFTRESEFQKSEENGGKRRKPEKISGFLFGIFCQDALRRVDKKDAVISTLISLFVLALRDTVPRRFHCDC
jgi:hypothetical protein